MSNLLTLKEEGALTGCACDEKQRNISHPPCHFLFICRWVSLFVLMSAPPDPLLSDCWVSSSLSDLTSDRQQASEEGAQLCLCLRIHSVSLLHNHCSLCAIYFLPYLLRFKPKLTEGQRFSKRRFQRSTSEIQNIKMYNFIQMWNISISVALNLITVSMFVLS